MAIVIINYAVFVRSVQGDNTEGGTPQEPFRVHLKSDDLSADELDVLNAAVGHLAQVHGEGILIPAELSKKLTNNDPKVIGSVFGPNKAYPRSLLATWEKRNGANHGIEAMTTDKVLVRTKEELLTATGGQLESLHFAYPNVKHLIGMSTPGVDADLALIAFYYERVAGADDPFTFKWFDGLLVLERGSSGWFVESTHIIAPPSESNVTDANKKTAPEAGSTD